MDRFYDMTLSVLGFRDEGSWCALGLEVDIRGYGETFEDACDDLRDLVSMQTSFAAHKKRPDMIWRPADPVCFARFAERRRRRCQDFSTPVETDEYRAESLPLPAPGNPSERRRDFVRYV